MVEVKETNLDFCPLEVLSHPLVWTEGGPFLHQHATAAVTHLVAVAGGDVLRFRLRHVLIFLFLCVVIVVM